AGGALATLLSHTPLPTPTPPAPPTAPASTSAVIDEEEPSGSSPFLPLLLSLPKAPTSILHLCASSDTGLQHRGAVCLLAICSGDKGARETVKGEGMGVVRGLCASRDATVRELGMEVLRLIGGTELVRKGSGGG